MSPGEVAITLGGVGLAVATLLSQIELWQRKEYRWDRLRSLLLGDEGRTLITGWYLGSLLALDIGWIALIIDRPTFAEIFGGISLLAAVANVVIRAVSRGVYRPQPTAKALLICGVAVAGSIGYLFLFFVSTQFLALQWVTLMIFMPLIVAASVGLVAIPVALRKRDIMAQAYKRRRALSKIVAVGITGSYGKTSTKFFLQQLLNRQANVVVSQAHRNSALTIAQDILQQLRPTTRTYIAEMGAYRRGEIKEIATLVQPRIGVLTAIGNQHLALFGSLETIAQTKWELIDALPTGGTAVLNAADITIWERGQAIPQKVVWYSAQPQTTDKAIYVQVQKLRIKPLELKTTLRFGKKTFEVTIPLVSEALLTSAIAAAAAAHALGVPTERIIENLQQLTPYERTMEPKQTAHDTVIIDDSYSANEAGVAVAVDHLRHFKDRPKVIVLAPLIELGPEAEAVHERLGRVVAKSDAQVYVTSAHYVSQLLAGGRAISPTFNVEVIAQPKRLVSEVKRAIKPGSVVLLEGRIPEVVRQAVLRSA